MNRDVDFFPGPVLGKVVARDLHATHPDDYLPGSHDLVTIHEGSVWFSDEISESAEDALASASWTGWWRMPENEQTALARKLLEAQE